MVPLWYYRCMSPKIHELIQNLESIGFVNKGDKNGYRNLRHTNGIKITVGGRLSQEAKQYQINDVNRAIEMISD